jgi:hypothetical protein
MFLGGNFSSPQSPKTSFFVISTFEHKARVFATKTICFGKLERLELHIVEHL